MKIKNLLINLLKGNTWEQISASDFFTPASGVTINGGSVNINRTLRLVSFTVYFKYKGSAVSANDKFSVATIKSGYAYCSPLKSELCTYLRDTSSSAHNSAHGYLSSSGILYARSNTAITGSTEYTWMYLGCMFPY